MGPRLIANPGIAAEEFDDETVLINIERGLYFSLQGSAIDLWHSFADAHAPGAVVEALSAQVEGTDRQALEKALELMQQHDLLRTCSPDSGAPESPLNLRSASVGAPVFEVYSDLAELIAIDPVHEVDAAAGWPVRPANFPDVA